MLIKYQQKYPKIGQKWQNTYNQRDVRLKQFAVTFCKTHKLSGKLREVQANG